jgi:MoaA/NifB/PqqE/SkfB family radical SAM enzyme
MIAIDVIEGCNFSCFFCPAKDIKENVYMDLDLYKRIILEAKELGITIVDLIPVKGEPFLHPDIYEILDFANQHMKEVKFITNLSAAIIPKLQKINLSKTIITVSYYGSTPEKFKELTVTNDNLFKIFHRKLDELKNSGLKYEVARRDENWIFDYDDIHPFERYPGTSKCVHHHRPRIKPNGDVTFCKFIEGRVPDPKLAMLGNLNTVSLKELIESPLRYKFYETESICKKYCVIIPETCAITPTFNSYKTISIAKKRYMENKDAVDIEYQNFENEIAQSTLQSNKS